MNRDPSTPDASIAAEILAYYERGAERERLSLGRGELERLRTQELLTRYLPPPPASVLDVGGGWGVYAFWLAAQGYDVHLIDPVPGHIEQAHERMSEPGIQPLASASVGDARRLEAQTVSVDVVLLLGPLYHLPERENRLLALGEAYRVLRAGGVVFAVGISRFASLLDGLSSQRLNDPEFARIVEQDLRDGQHRNPSDRQGYFTTAFFHHPDELREEVEASGFAVLDVLGIEGPGYWMVHDLEARLSEPTQREHVLLAALAIEREPTLLGLGPHLMAVARKP